MRLLKLICVPLLTVGFLASPIKAPKLLQDPSKDYTNLVVQVIVNDKLGGLLSRGSGVIIESKKDKLLVITAKHVVDPVEYPEAFIHILFKGIPSKIATEVVANGSKDVAILVIPSNKIFPKARIKDTVTPLEEVVNAGFPIPDELVITQGLVNYRSTLEDDLWVCTAPTHPGNSGGGVFDKATGELVGICVAVATYRSAFGAQIVNHIHFFLPLGDIKNWINKVK